MTDQIVVTGGASGIGRAVAADFFQRGWMVHIVDSDTDAGPAAAAEVRGQFVAADVTSLAALDDALHGALGGPGSVAALVTCAGITRIGAADQLSEADWRAVVDVDLTGTYLSCRAMSPYLKDGASVVTIGSIASARTLAGRIAYSAAKAGVVSLTRTLALEWASRGIRVNCVGPGWVETPFLQAAAARGDVDLDELAERPPLRGLVGLDDVTAAIGYLCSPAARFVTGQTLFVDGGWAATT